MPIRAPSGRSARLVPPAVTSASRGSSRSGTAARSMPSAGAVGRSLSECTATSTLPASSASRRAETKTPVPLVARASSRSGSPERSPWVDTRTSSVGSPSAAVSASATSCDCVRASALARVPTRITADLPRLAACARQRQEPSEPPEHRATGATGATGARLSPTWSPNSVCSASAYIEPSGPPASSLTRTVGVWSTLSTTRRTVRSTSARHDRVQVTQPAPQPGQLGGDDGVGLRPQRHHRRRDRGGLDLGAPDADLSATTARARATSVVPSPSAASRRPRASRSTRVTPAWGPSGRGATSRGRARSTRTSGRRCAVRHRGRATSAASTTWPTEPVQLTTTSQLAQQARQVLQRGDLAADRRGQPGGRSRAAVDDGHRAPTPLAGERGRHQRRHASAPTTATRAPGPADRRAARRRPAPRPPCGCRAGPGRSRRGRGGPRGARAPRPRPSPARPARRPGRGCRRMRTWPRIWASPSAIESSPATTWNRCSTAAPS